MSNSTESRGNYYSTDEELQARTQLGHIGLLTMGIFIALLVVVPMAALSGVAIMFATAGLIVASAVAATFAVTIAPSLIKSAFELTGRLFTAIRDKLKPAKENTVKQESTVVRAVHLPKEVEVLGKKIATSQVYNGPSFFGSGSEISAEEQANLQTSSSVPNLNR